MLWQCSSAVWFFYSSWSKPQYPEGNGQGYHQAFFSSFCDPDSHSHQPRDGNITIVGILQHTWMLVNILRNFSCLLCHTDSHRAPSIILLMKTAPWAHGQLCPILTILPTILLLMAQEAPLISSHPSSPCPALVGRGPTPLCHPCSACHVEGWEHEGLALPASLDQQCAKYWENSYRIVFLIFWKILGISTEGYCSESSYLRSQWNVIVNIIQTTLGRGCISS